LANGNVAFANSKGGRVLIGLDDGGKPVKGFTLGNESLQKWVNEVKNKTQPSIIPDAEVGDFGGAEDKVVKFIEKSNQGKEMPLTGDPLTVLTKFELIRDTQVTDAGFLLFAKNDVFQAAIELGRFSTPTSIKDGSTVRSDLFTELEEVLGFIRKHINKEYIITGDPQREGRWQYPMPALREIVTNMVVHRDYMNSGDSSVKIFDDYIEFFNPGHLPDTITIEQLLADDYSSYARNRSVFPMLLWFYFANCFPLCCEWDRAFLSIPLQKSW
jgi:predicted HTH transcriptional regulator